MDLFEAILWLTLNLYHEGRGEELIGQQAIIHVTLNRAEKRRLSIKETVTQPFQFTWTINNNIVPEDFNSFISNLNTVSKTISDIDFTGGATHYHSVSIPDPYWVKNMRFIATIGTHKFYK